MNEIKTSQEMVINIETLKALMDESIENELQKLKLLNKATGGYYSHLIFSFEQRRKSEWVKINENRVKHYDLGIIMEIVPFDILSHILVCEDCKGNPNSLKNAENAPNINFIILGDQIFLGHDSETSAFSFYNEFLRTLQNIIWDVLDKMEGKIGGFCANTFHDIRIGDAVAHKTQSMRVLTGIGKVVKVWRNTAHVLFPGRELPDSVKIGDLEKIKTEEFRN